MQKATLTLPPAENLTLADFAARFLMNKPLPNMHVPLNADYVKDTIEAKLVPLPLAQRKKPVEQMNLLEVIGVAKSDDETRMALNGVLVEFNTRIVAATDGRRLLYYENAPQDFIDHIQAEFRRLRPDLAVKEMVTREWDGNKKKMVVTKSFHEAKSCILRNVTKLAKRQENPAKYDEFMEGKMQYMGETYEFIDESYPNWRGVVKNMNYGSARGFIPDIWEKRGYLYAAYNLLKNNHDQYCILFFDFNVVGDGVEFDGQAMGFAPEYIIDGCKVFETFGIKPATYAFHPQCPILMYGEGLNYVLMPGRDGHGDVNVSRMNAAPVEAALLREVTYMGKKMPPCFLTDSAEPVLVKPESKPEEPAKNDEPVAEKPAEAEPEKPAVAEAPPAEPQPEPEPEPVHEPEPEAEGQDEEVEEQEQEKAEEDAATEDAQGEEDVLDGFLADNPQRRAMAMRVMGRYRLSADKKSLGMVIDLLKQWAKDGVLHTATHKEAGKKTVYEVQVDGFDGYWSVGKLTYEFANYLLSRNGDDSTAAETVKDDEAPAAVSAPQVPAKKKDDADELDGFLMEDLKERQKAFEYLTRNYLAASGMNLLDTIKEWVSEGGVTTATRQGSDNTTVYEIRLDGQMGGYWQVDKTAYDFANHLLGRACVTAA